MTSIERDRRDWVTLLGSGVQVVTNVPRPFEGEDDDEDLKGLDDNAKKIVKALKASTAKLVATEVSKVKKEIDKTVGDVTKMTKAFEKQVGDMKTAIDKALEETDDDEGDEDDPEASDDDDDAEDDDDEPDDKTKRRESFENRRINKEVVALRKRVEESERKDLEKSRLLKEGERDRLLTSALQAVGVADGAMDDALELMRKRTKWDGDDKYEKGEWLFVTKEKAEIPDFQVGIEDSLPPYLRRPAMKDGGSGGGGGGSRRVAQLDEKRKERDTLEKAAQTNATDDNITRYKRAAREVQKLEAEASGSPKK